MSSSSSTSSILLNVYKVTGQFPWSSLRETDRGVSGELSVNTVSFSHFVQLKMLNVKLNDHKLTR